ncbi:MAG TPA: transglutaminase-like domain-containing protein [Solirubrobacteraceae bacterium]
MSAAALPAGVRPAPARVRAPRIAVRLVAIGALAVFGAQAWGGMVRPGADGRMLGAAAAGIGLAIVVLLAQRLPRAARVAVDVAVAVAGAAAALLLAGVPLNLLDRESWGELANGLGQGIEALPGLNVPYRGVDEWNRVAMLLGGTALAVAGVVVAVRRPVLGIVLLAVLYAVPAVEFDAQHPWLDGFAFALLLGAALWAERVAAREAPFGVVVVLAAGLVALALAPRLDAAEPWVDYESLAQSLGERGTTTFSWSHRYGPLDWPRDGRELLRIEARTGAYWKATTLTEFDGRRWVETRPQGLEDDPEADTPRPRWVQTVRVSVRNLSSEQFVAPGTALDIRNAPRTPVKGAPGSFVSSGKPLRRGHAYVVKSYVPRPRRLEIEAAGTNFPTSLWPYLSMQLPQSIGGPPPIDPATHVYQRDAPPAFVVFSGFGDRRDALGYLAGRGFGERVGTDWVRSSAYARTYALARRLARRSASPYAYAKAIQAFLSRGFRYSETPPRRPLPLDAFLFRDKVGYCQQFSGAMALLLRMGGVPARVAAGFSPGTRDESRGEYVVRDYDAHSWVEAYFPGYGWITFDPTPAIAPARAQLAALDGQEEDPDGGSASGTRGSERAQDPRALGQGEDAGSGGGGGSGLLVVGGVLLGLFVFGGAAYGVAAARWRARYGPEAAAAELVRALRRTGRGPRPGATLAQLEESLRWAPEAAAYIRTVRAARFGFGSSAPSREQRRALRRELGSGLGLRGRVRALWALPPF